MKTLNNFGFINPLESDEKYNTEWRKLHHNSNNGMEVDIMKEAKTGDVYKFEKEGDQIQGILVGYEESKQFKDSYAVSLRVDDDIKVVFVSAIVIDLFKKNEIKNGMLVSIAFTGKKKSETSGLDYNTYKVFYE